MKVAKKQTGALRAGVITAFVLLLLSLLFNGLSITVTMLLLKLGTAAIYVGFLVNILGAAFSAWVGARLAMVGREMKMARSTRAAFIAAFIPSLLNLVSGIVGGIFSVASGRGGSYMPTIVEAISFFVVAFFVSKTVFKGREIKPALPQEDNLDKS
jgi:hypothetical protein